MGEHIVECPACGGRGFSEGYADGATDDEPCRQCNGHGKVLRSDKYEWSRPGFVPLKLTDPAAQWALRSYVQRRKHLGPDPDPEFSRDLLAAIRMQEEEA